MDYSGSDFYCEIALQGKVFLKKEYESERVIAFHHTRPYWPVHIVVAPKKHILSFTSLSEDEMPIVVEMLNVIKILASKVEKENGAARIVTNLGKYQDSKHLHFHIYSGEQLAKSIAY